MSFLPTRDDDRTMGQLRKRLPLYRRRNLERPAPATIMVRDDEESGSDSEDDRLQVATSTEAESPTKSTQVPQKTISTPESPSPTTASRPTLTQTPPPATTAPGVPPQMGIGQPSAAPSLTTAPRLTSTRARPVEVSQTTDSTSLRVTSQSQIPTFLSLSSASGLLSTSQRRSASATLRLASTTTRTRSTVLPTLPFPQAVSEVVVPSGNTRAHTTLSHGSTVALEVIGAITGVAILIGIAFFFFRRLKRRRWQRQAELVNNPPLSPAYSESNYGPTTVKSGAAPSFYGRFQKIRTYIANKGSGSRDFGGLRSPTAESAVVRRERLGLVKGELLSEKEGNARGGFLRSPRPAEMVDSRNVSRWSESEDSWVLKRELGAREGIEAPTKAFLKRNTTGKMVMRGVVSGDGDGQGRPKGLGLNLGAYRGSRKDLEEDEELLIQNSAEWQGQQGNDRVQAPAGLRYNMWSERNQDPTMMSGGLRSSRRWVGNEGIIEPEYLRSPYKRPIQQQIGGGRIDVAAWKNLEGLRRGDPLVEHGMDRQSFVSGWQGSTTSWGTNVWDRLERQRELREGRERMEGGLGGNMVAMPANRESSIAKWRDPVSWVNDQADRRVDVVEKNPGGN